MKKLILLVAAAGTAIATSAIADDKDMHNPDQFFMKMDINSDGNITKAEHDAFGQKKFTKMDANGDGMISKSEFRAHKMEDNTPAAGMGSPKSNKGDIN